MRLNSQSIQLVFHSALPIPFPNLRCIFRPFTSGHQYRRPDLRFNFPWLLVPNYFFCYLAQIRPDIIHILYCGTKLFISSNHPRQRIQYRHIRKPRSQFPQHHLHRVLDALSWMIGGDKKLRPAIENMYNVRADLGEIAEEIVRHKKPRKIEPEIGTPVLMARCERAKDAAEIWKRNGECAVEYKLDGLRIQAHIQRSVSLFSRGLENVTSMYPDVVEGLKKQIKKDCIVEGEMIALGKNGKFLPFQETVQRKRKYGIAEMAEKVPLTIFLFDLLMTDRTNMTNKTYMERRGELEKLVNAGNIVKLMPMEKVENETEIERFFRKALADGCEGVIAKKLDGVYAAGARDFNWIKYKKSYDKSALSDTLDLVVLGYDVGQGKRAGFGIGDFLAGVYQPEADKYLTVAKIGTGLTDEEWRKIKLTVDNYQLTVKPENYEVGKQMNCDFWVEPKLVVEIKADEITSSPMHTAGYALRFPRLVSFRKKKPEDATSVEELKRLYTLQYAR